MSLVNLDKLSESEKAEIGDKLSENLPILRKKLNLTQEDLAKQIGVTKQTIANYETKRVKMAWTTTFALFMFFSLNVTTANLLAPLGIISKKLISCIPGLDNLINLFKQEK